MKAYKLEVLIIDFDEHGAESIVSELENANFPNDCLTPRVKKVEVRDIGDWNDDHPLNKNTICNEEYKRLFEEKPDENIKVPAYIKLSEGYNPDDLT